MRVLIACEYSGIVRDAFRALGHEAMSCDILPTEAPGPHYEGPVEHVIDWGWDLVIAHPPCTYLCNSGVRWLFGRGQKGAERDAERWRQMEAAAAFFRMFLDLPCPRVAVENPVMHRYAREIVGRGPDQTIQPYQHGHPESKRTGLWIRGLPLLTPTALLERPASGRWENQTPTGQNKLGPSANRSHERSRTYAGIARAMAEQWGR